MRQLFLNADREKKMGFLKPANIRKTVYYFKRNGLKNTFFAVLERLVVKKKNYHYIEVSEETLETQREYPFSHSYKFSILVPAYETKESYLREMIDSVLNQTYQNFELIIADASESCLVERVVESFTDDRIVYKRLESNNGISENTNAGLAEATGDYIGLLDHDDILTKDALFEVARAIEEEKKSGREPMVFYSDEDKCDSEAKHFFEPHEKLDFNFDLLLTNNYFCHFLVMKSTLLKRLGFRKEYDGAQDYDLVLRSVYTLIKENGYEKTDKELIYHIPKVLYHWRCHEASTAENPESKQYAYEAGKDAVNDFLHSMECFSTIAIHSCHVGFYRIISGVVFEGPGKIGAYGGNLVNIRNRICGGMEQNGKNPFRGMKVYFSGYMHRAAMRQTVDFLDLRCMQVNLELADLFEEITGMEYREPLEIDLFDWKKYKKTDEEWRNLSRKFCQELTKRGYRLVYNPQCVSKIRRKFSV